MGITSSDVLLLEKALQIKPIKYVIELGSQNLYLDGLNTEKPPFASEWYEARELSYFCIDMAGDNNALQINLANRLEDGHILFDLVTDFGTSEHVVDVAEFQSVAFHDGHINSMYPQGEPKDHEIMDGFYAAWYNKHKLAKPGGLIVSVNPKTGNWPGHGYTYLDRNFYVKLAELMGYKIHHLEENPAMGNTANGWNVECILEKNQDAPFVSFEDFQNCKQYRQ